MKHRWLIVAIVVALALLLIASCGLTMNRSTDQTLRGRMLLWHTLNRSETEALNSVIDSFNELHPNVTVKVQVFSTTVELNEQFINASNTGLGPDTILAPSTWVRPLQSARLIAPIDDALTSNVIARFHPALFNMLQVNEQSYGLPLAIDTLGIYVNRQLVETPATTLAELLEQANAGTTILIPTNFVDAFWGIQAFGGQLFNAEGEAILDQGGFANWLAWLRDARNAPGMIQDNNRDVLRQRFLAGEAGYYIGYASEVSEITAALGEENITVLPQPSGPVGPAGPFVSSQAFFFGSSSSANQRHLAIELAKFITNSEQSSRLMRLVRYVPANINVRINARLFPTVAAFATQARNGIPYPAGPEFEAVVRHGNEAYIRALEGGESPAEVAFVTNNNINEANGFAVQAQPSYTCSGLGTIHLAHSWQQPDDLAALDEIIANFRAICPHIIIETKPLTEVEFARQFSAVGDNGLRATFGIASQAQILQLVTPEAEVQNLGNILSSTTLQRFMPISIDAMRSRGTLYGLPFALDVDALFYNRKLTTIPAQTLDDLRAQAMAGIPITLDTRFENAFWGIRAFGGQLFATNGAAQLDQGGMADWLLWLRESRDNFGIHISNDGDELLRRFLAGESAYYVGGADELAVLQEALGEELAIALLPSGPAGPAQPLVRADGFVLRAGITEALQTLALEFMRFATDAESQTRLMNEADIIPANANVMASDETFLGILSQQAQTGFLVPNSSFWQLVVELGTAAYTDVLEDRLDPTVVVADLTAAINRANGIVVTPVPTATPEDVLLDEEATPSANSEVDEQSDEAQGGDEDATPPSPSP